MSLLSSITTYTGVGLGMQDEVGEIVVVQDDENDVIEYLEDDVEVVDVM